LLLVVTVVEIAVKSHEYSLTVLPPTPPQGIGQVFYIPFLAYLSRGDTYQENLAAHRG
jgi:hypothetical protein